MESYALDPLVVRGTLAGVYPGPKQTSQLHLELAVGSASRCFFVTCPNSMLGEPLPLGEEVAIESQPFILSTNAGLDGEHVIPMAYVGLRLLH